MSFDQNASDVNKPAFDIPQTQIANSPEPSIQRRSPLKSTGTRRNKNKENGKKSFLPALNFHKLEESSEKPKVSNVRRPRK